MRRAQDQARSARSKKNGAAKRVDQIARPRRAQTCVRSKLRAHIFVIVNDRKKIFITIFVRMSQPVTVF